MLLDRLRELLGGHSAPEEVAPVVAAMPSLVPDAALAEDDDPVWPSARIAVAEALWGEGFLFPGGREATLRLATPLGLSAASSLLLLGAGSGGAPRAIAAELGGWVTGYEANPRLAALANERNQRGGLGKRAAVEIWDPAAPRFPPRYFHHVIAIEALNGAAPEPVLTALASALKPGGQLVLVELIADRPLDASDAIVAGWTRLQQRPANAPGELGVSKLLAHLGFDVRIVEDVSRRHMRHAIRGWREAVQAMEDARPTLHQVALIVREAELWLARLRLMRSGQLRLVRWHAIGRA